MREGVGERSVESSVGEGSSEGEEKTERREGG
jgi:hypothetical protein